jgi:hypothetical protein
VTAHSICWRKKQSSQHAFTVPVRPPAIASPQPSFASPTVHIKAIPPPARKLDFRKTQQVRNIPNYLETAGNQGSEAGRARNFRSFVMAMTRAR